MHLKSGLRHTVGPQDSRHCASVSVFPFVLADCVWGPLFLHSLLATSLGGQKVRSGNRELCTACEHGIKYPSERQFW